MSAAPCLVTGRDGVHRRRRSCAGSAPAGVRVRGLARTRAAGGGRRIRRQSISPRTHFEPRCCCGIDTVYHLAAKTHDLAGDGGRRSRLLARQRRRHAASARRRAGDARHGGLVFVSSVKAQAEETPRAIDESRRARTDDRVRPLEAGSRAPGPGPRPRAAASRRSACASRSSTGRASGATSRG